MKVKLTLEYVGDAFHGFQDQGPALVTVQGELERGLAVVLNSWFRKSGLTFVAGPKINGSGRTDAGVHAKGQVASFDWPEQLPVDNARLYRLTAALNGVTSPALTVLSCEEVPADFDPRHSPHLKLYSYRFVLGKNSFGLEKGRAWHVGGKLNLPEMIRAARLFTGQHDFAAFRAADCSAKSTERTILSSELTRTDRRTMIYTIEGRGFLKQMVRIIAGTLVAVGRGSITSADVAGLITGGKRGNAGDTAPADGLTLEWVRYLEQDYFEKKIEKPAGQDRPSLTGSV